ncbi:glycosyltransferase family 2 protein [Desulfocurvibacter africanus]|uniref:Glycosyl transferase family 2 n=1 Tax=Desulfocurvibacter africanus subsp. africanus str. Walvis Bay TaxID=690850 RepID=F3YW50_DESAF|nr:glycosyltransferase family 2 protein [Desulfocurvibacter africanus]EGJ49080.1 glycosyl transferase family 2 [Desulfocurvibacter africanus subsp. africanus str. Walvis Bay]
MHRAQQWAEKGNSGPLFSIVTVVRNGADSLERTIRSMAIQDFSGYEYLILDGASSDGTMQIVERNAAHVTMFRSEPDKGVYDGMNKALSLCRGEYVYFLNCGDWLAAPDILSRVAAQITAGRADIVYGNVYNAWLAEERLVRTRILDPRDLLYDTVCHQAMFASRRVFEAIGGFDMRYAICADREWLLRSVLRHGFRLAYTDVPVCVFDGGGLSSNARSKQRKRWENWLLNVRYFPLRSVGFFMRKAVVKLTTTATP